MSLSGRVFRDKSAQSLGRKNHQATALQLQPLLSLPILQLLIGAFARDTDHLADFPLRHLNLLGGQSRGRRLIKMQQNLGKTSRQAKKYDIFDLLARFSQTCAKYGDQSNCNFGIVLDQRNEIRPFDDQQFAIINCNSVRGPLPSIEKGDFAKELAGHHQIEYRILPLSRGGADSYRASTNGIELRADISFSKYDSASFYFSRYDARGEAIDDGIAQISKKWMGPEQCLLIERLRLTACSHSRFPLDKFSTKRRYDKIARHGRHIDRKASKQGQKPKFSLSFRPPPSDHPLRPGCLRVAKKSIRTL